MRPVVHAFQGVRHNNPFCLSQAATIVALAHTTQQQQGPGEAHYTGMGLDKCTSYNTLHYKR